MLQENMGYEYVPPHFDNKKYTKPLKVKQLPKALRAIP